MQVRGAHLQVRRYPLDRLLRPNDKFEIEDLSDDELKTAVVPQQSTSSPEILGEQLKELKISMEKMQSLEEEQPQIDARTGRCPFCIEARGNCASSSAFR